MKKENYMKNANRWMNETYEMNFDGDMDEEHAKAFITKFIEATKGEMSYPDAQPLFNEFIKENEAEEHREIIIEAISDLCEKIVNIR